MNKLGLYLFGLFLLIIIILDIAMIISLLKPGDERRQMMVWKAGTFTLAGTMGRLIINIIESVVKVEDVSVNPFSVITSAAFIYFIFLLYYKKRYGG